MTIKAFNTAVQDRPELNGVGTPFEVDGFKMTAYKPDEGQFAMLMASVGRGSTDGDRIAGLINFLVNIIDTRGADHLQKRLLTPVWKDPFGIEEVEQIMEWLAEEWTGNPTQEPSGSTASPSTTGSPSTGRTPLLT